MGDFDFAASPGDLWPAIMGAPEEEEAASGVEAALGRELVIAHRANAQTITTDTDTVITFDDIAKDIGTISHANLTTDADHIYLGIGLWYLRATVNWAAGATGYRYTRIRFTDGSSETIAEERVAATPTLGVNQEISLIVPIPRLVGQAGEDPTNLNRACGVNVRHTQGVDLDVSSLELHAYRLRSW